MAEETFLCIYCCAEFTEELPDGARIHRPRDGRLLPAICRACSRSALERMCNLGGTPGHLADLGERLAEPWRGLPRETRKTRKKARLTPHARRLPRSPRHDLRVRQDALEDARPDLEPTEDLVGVA